MDIYIYISADLWPDFILFLCFPDFTWTIKFPSFPASLTCRNSDISTPQIINVTRQIIKKTTATITTATFRFCFTGRDFLGGDHSRLGHVPQGLLNKNLRRLLVLDYLQAKWPFCHPIHTVAVRGSLLLGAKGRGAALQLATLILRALNKLQININLC